MAAPVPPPDPDDMFPRLGDILCFDSTEETDRFLTFNPDPLEYTSLGGEEGNQPLDFRLRGLGRPAPQGYLTGVGSLSDSFEFSTDFRFGDVYDGIVNGGESAYQFGKSVYEFGQDVEEDVNDWGERTVGGAWSPIKDAAFGIAGGMSLKAAAGGFVNSEFTQDKIREYGDHLADTMGLGRGGDGMNISMGLQHIPVGDKLEFAMGVWYQREYGIEQITLFETGSGNFCLDFTSRFMIGATGTIDIAAARNAGVDLNVGAELKAALKFKETGMGFVDNFELLSARYNVGYDYDLLNGGGYFGDTFSFGMGWEIYM